MLNAFTQLLQYRLGVLAMLVATAIGTMTTFCAGHCEMPSAWPCVALTATVTPEKRVNDQMLPALPPPTARA